MFAGLPIEGDVNRYTSGLKEQHDPQELFDALLDVLHTPDVEAVRWRQYTPYFNDGDPCTFSAYGASVRRTDDPDDVGDYSDGFYDSYEFIGYDVSKPVGQRSFYKPETKFLGERIKRLDDLISGGHHDVLLNEKFGDPAEVTATLQGITVSHYEHD